MDIENDRHCIEPFIDWLIDFGKISETSKIYSDMEEYLSELKASRLRVQAVNSPQMPLPPNDTEIDLCGRRRIKK